MYLDFRSIAAVAASAAAAAAVAERLRPSRPIHRNKNPFDDINADSRLNYKSSNYLFKNDFTTYLPCISKSLTTQFHLQFENRLAFAMCRPFSVVVAVPFQGVIQLLQITTMLLHNFFISFTVLKYARRFQFDP